MSFMKRNVNFGLFLLIILIIGSFVGFSIYFQQKFSDLNTEYTIKRAEIDALSKNLADKQANLSQTSYKLQVQSERETEIAGKYSSLQEQNDALKKEKQTLEEELAKKTAAYNQKVLDLAKKEAELSIATTQITQLNTNVAKLTAESDSLKSDLSRVCTQLASLGGNSTRCG
jgi:chromosome segregation ATPase